MCKIKKRVHRKNKNFLFQSEIFEKRLQSLFNYLRWPQETRRNSCFVLFPGHVLIQARSGNKTGPIGTHTHLLCERNEIQYRIVKIDTCVLVLLVQKETLIERGDCTSTRLLKWHTFRGENIIHHLMNRERENTSRNEQINLCSNL